MNVVKEIRVADYGAVANDGQDHSNAIRQAVEEASAYSEAKVIFDQGVYCLDHYKEDYMIGILSTSNITLTGAVDREGKPATTLMIRLPLGNDVDSRHHIRIMRSKNVRIENFIFDYEQRFSSAGEVVRVDTDTDTIEVDVFPGQSHFDGMKCYSSNSWNIERKELNHVRALTIGVDKTVFDHTWKKVEGGDGRRYQLTGMGVAEAVSLGDGMSWHFNVIGSKGDSTQIINVSECENISLANLLVYSAMGAAFVLVRNKNISVQRVRIEPEGTSLAVTPRDGFWFKQNGGTLNVDEVYVKGVRWDPFNFLSGFMPIQSISEDGCTIYATATEVSMLFLKEGDRIVFWSGNQPTERILKSYRHKGDQYEFTLEQRVEPWVQAGTYMTPGCWNFDKAVIQNTVIEGNCGTGILYQNENLLLENCQFRNNTYDNIALGPIDNHEGCFARNICIRNNILENSTWINKFHMHDGSISLMNGYQSLYNSSYNCNILIEKNVFRGQSVAVSIRNAQKVEIRDNLMENVETPIFEENDTNSKYWNGLKEN